MDLNQEKSMDFDELLINLVREKQFLYDKKNTDYKNESRKENGWIVIAEILHSDAETVKRRWENLRDRFVRSLRYYEAIPYTGSGPLHKKINFPHHNSMLWLAPYIRKRRMTASSLTTVDVNPSSILGIKDEPQEYEYTIGNPLHDNSSEGESCSKMPTMQETFSKAVDSFSSFVTTMESSQSSDVLFLRSVAEDMKMIPPKQKLRFKREVLSLLEKYIP